MAVECFGKFPVDGDNESVIKVTLNLFPVSLMNSVGWKIRIK